jgi:acyl-coenzyme A thioesterase PaaI-like protein
VSEAAPGTGDDPMFASAPRAELAQAVRELIEASMTTPDATDEMLLDATATVRSVTVALLPDSRSSVAAGYVPRDHHDYLPRSPVVGEASPMSPRIDWEIVDGRCHARGTFGAAYEGPPGYVHGGMVALAFDEVLGIVNIANGCPGMTGTLSIRYRRPTPLYREVRFEAWVELIEGRRVRSRAELHADDTLCAEAEGLFIQPRPELAMEYFGRPMTGDQIDMGSPSPDRTA